MLGSLRFILALAVAFSHMGLTPNFHFGAMSVTIFFLIAGYVMTHSFRINFGGNLANIYGFYVDRFFRIYPLYILSLVLIGGFIGISGYGRLYLDPVSIFVDLTVLPMNMHETIMNPPAWSLGTEAQFYLILPFLVRFPWLKYSLLPISYAVFTVATFEIIPPLQWAYKYIPGTLYLFIVGSIIYDMRTDKTRSRSIVTGINVIATLHLAVLATFPAHINQPYALETLCGLSMGAACLVLLGDSKPTNLDLDNWLGKMSYPLFLSHVTALYLFDHLRSIGAFSPSLRGAVVLQMLASLAISVPMMLLDDQFQAFRKRLQLRNVAKPQRRSAPIVKTVAAD